MGRFTNMYVPVPLVLVVRVNEVCSSNTVTVALGMTPPDASVTTPVMPPSVCCANRGEMHSAATATIANSRGSRVFWIRMEYLNLLASVKGKSQRTLECQKDAKLNPTSDFLGHLKRESGDRRVYCALMDFVSSRFELQRASRIAILA